MLFRRSQGLGPRDFRQMALAGMEARSIGAALPEHSFGAKPHALAQGGIRR